eukprot:6218289-Pyramimonas_sp.AAC.1
MHFGKAWGLQRGQIFHAQCWGRVARAHVDRQLAGTTEGTATVAPCAICRGVGLITAEFDYALTGDQDAANRHVEILRGDIERRGPREELNRIFSMMTNTAVPTTTPAGQPASSANAGQATEATAPALDAPMSLLAEAANNAGIPAMTAPAALPANDVWLRR